MSNYRKDNEDDEIEDDVYYEDDDVADEYEDDEDDSIASRVGGRVNPYSGGKPTSNLPGRSNVVGSSGSRYGSSSPSSAPTAGSGSSGTRYGSSSPSSAPAAGGGSSGTRYGSSPPSSAPAAGSGSSGTRYGSSSPSSAPAAGSGSSGTRYGSSPPSSPTARSGSSSPFTSSPSSTPTTAGSGSSGARYGSSPPPASSSSSSGARYGSAPPSGKPEDKSKSGGSRFGGLAGRIGVGKKDDTKNTKASTSKSAASGVGSRVGGFLGRGKPDDKRTSSSSPTASASARSAPQKSGGIGSRLGFGKRGDDKKSGSSATAGTGTRSPYSSSSSPYSSSTRSTTASSTASSGAPARRPFGSMGRSGSQSAPATKATGAKSEGRRFPFFGGGTKKEARPAARPRTSKAPRVQGEGLTLDNKLDILGVALVLGSLALFFSTLSSTKGALTEAINGNLGRAFGQGAIAVPIAMLAVGVWLIARHFGDEAPVVAPSRIAGIIIAFLGILVLLQYIETFSYTNVTSLADLQLRLEGSWLYGRGGGYIGGQLYYLLVSNITELGAFFALVAWLVIGIMLTFDLSLRDLALVTIGTWRSFSDARQRRSQRVTARRAELQAQQIAATSAASVAVTRPENEQLPAGAERPALPAAATAMPAEPPRAIPISMGGRQVATVKGNDYVPLEAVPAATSAGKAAAGENKPGVFGKLRGVLPLSTGSRSEATPAVPTTRNDSEKEAQQSGGGLRARLFSRSSSTAVTPAAPGSTPAVPATASTAAPAPAKPGEVFGQPIGKPGATPPTGAPGTQSPAPAFTSAPSEPRRNPAEEAPSRLGDMLRQPAAQQRPATNQPAGPFPRSEQPAGSGSPLSDRLNVRPFGASSGQPSPSERPAAQAATPEQRNQRPAASQQPAAGQSASPAPAEPSPFSRPPVSAQPAPSLQEQKPAERPADPSSLAERQERLNAIRAGQLNRTPETTATPPVTRPPTSPQPYTPPSSDSRPAAAPQPRPEPVVRSTPPPAPPVMSRSAAHSGQRNRDWKLPDLSTLLNPGSEQEFDRESLLQRARVIEDTLGSFGAPGKVVEVNTGPVITQFAVEPDYLTTRSGKKNRVKVSAIAQLDKDMQLALGAKSIRVEAPVPGKGYVGIEVPNEEASLVSLRDVMEADEFKRIKSPLAISLGMSVDGTPVAADLSSMPHLLIAGTTGSGKSVCVNSIIASIITKNTPKDVKFIMVDPKRVELTGYNGIPHLVAPVVVDLERIVGVLKWVTREMDERYKRFSNAGARNIEDFNKHLPENEEWMPYIIVIIDELADLMMLAPDETERVITRIAALARATGIHLVIATQRPSVDVVTGLIKANFPARIAFAVAGGVDSRVILDQPGAERLLGRGDMLYMSGDSPAPVRLQGVFVSDTEISNITRFWKMQAGEDIQTRPISTLVLDNTLADESRQVAPTPMSSSTTRQQAFWDRDGDSDSRSSVTVTGSPAGTLGEDEDQDDELYGEAVELVQRLNKASVSLLQRRLRIGYTRAARLIDKMEEEGIVGPAESGSKPREVLTSGGGGG